MWKIYSDLRSTYCRIVHIVATYRRSWISQRNITHNSVPRWKWRSCIEKNIVCLSINVTFDWNKRLNKREETSRAKGKRERKRESNFRTLFNTINRWDTESKTRSIHMYGRPRESDIRKMELFFTEQQTDVTGRTSSEKFHVPGLKTAVSQFWSKRGDNSRRIYNPYLFHGSKPKRQQGHGEKKLRSSRMLPGSIRNETNWTTLYHAKPRFPWNAFEGDRKISCRQQNAVNTVCLCYRTRTSASLLSFFFFFFNSSLPPCFPFLPFSIPSPWSNRPSLYSVLRKCSLRSSNTGGTFRFA